MLEKLDSLGIKYVIRDRVGAYCHYLLGNPITDTLWQFHGGVDIDDYVSCGIYARRRGIFLYQRDAILLAAVCHANR